jgi:outer membrane protein
MRGILFLILFNMAFALAADPETHTLTMREAVERALAQNPEVIMARMDEARAAANIRMAKDPFTPRVGAGSGLAYSNGFPLSIDGSAPAVIQAKANQYLFNRPQTYAVAQAKETARGAGFTTAGKADEIAFRAASLFLDADRAARLTEMAGKQVESLTKVLETLQARVAEGRELPITAQAANVNLLRARQRLMSLESDRDFAGRSLATALGYESGDTVKPSADERTTPPLPENESAAARAAMAASNELKRLDSSLTVKDLEIKGDRAQRLPRVDLVAQYALLAKFSHYDQYFTHFQRNNGEIGASIQIPLLTGASIRAQVGLVESDQQKIRTEMQMVKDRIALDIHQSYQTLAKADMARQVAQADLELTREQLSVVLAQMNEGRATLRQVEEARFSENEKWIAFYDAQFNTERARLDLLRQTGELRAALP